MCTPYVYRLYWQPVCAPQVRTAFRKPELVTTWEVVCSGFFDPVGLYSEVRLNLHQPRPVPPLHPASGTLFAAFPHVFPLATHRDHAP